jgi:GDP-L-fucose synthase
MKIIITGSSGFLGTHLTKILTELGHELVLLNSKNCDLTISDSLEKYNLVSYDCIYHLAAWTQAGDFCLKHPGEQWIINQKINTNVLDWWLNYQSNAKLVFMGTSCAYSPENALVESNYMIGEPIDSLYTYAMTKRMLYQGARALNKQFAMNYLCAVPSTLYGSGYHMDGRQMHFIFDLIKKIIRGKEFCEPVVLWGDGHQSREIMLVDDFVKILIELTEGVNNEVVNIGAGKELTIKDFARKICDVVGYDFNKVQYDLTKYVGAKSKCLDISKAKSLVSSYITTDLDIGISTTVNWFYKNKAY